MVFYNAAGPVPGPCAGRELAAQRAARRRREGAKPSRGARLSLVRPCGGAKRSRSRWFWVAAVRRVYLSPWRWRVCSRSISFMRWSSLVRLVAYTVFGFGVWAVSVGCWFMVSFRWSLARRESGVCWVAAACGGAPCANCGASFR